MKQIESTKENEAIIQFALDREIKQAQDKNSLQNILKDVNVNYLTI